MKIELLTLNCRLRCFYPGSHTHHSWQIDQYQKGVAKIYLEDQIVEVPDGDCFLAPSYVKHQIIGPKNSILNSLKFDPETTRFNRIPPMIISFKKYSNVLSELFNPDLLNREIKGHYLGILLLELLQTCLLPGESEKTLDKRVAQVIHFMRRNVFDSPRLDDLAKHVNMSKSNFVRLFREQTGGSAMRKMRQLKGEKAAEMLRHSDLTISQIADVFGFSNLQAFSRFFHHEYAIYPREFRTRQLPKDKDNSISRKVS